MHSDMFIEHDCIGDALLLSAGRVRNYGESPVKRARLALEGFTWGCPEVASAADLLGISEAKVAAESVMSQQAADLAPGTLVEYRSREAYLIGGWFRARVVQVMLWFLPEPLHAFSAGASIH